MALPRVATIQDISGVGRCSLTAAIPILSTMGFQACPLPTAVLSNQTGFEDYAVVSLTGQLAASVSRWKKQRMAFEGVCTGFLMNTRQVHLAGEFIDYARSRGALIVIDPVMGDSGRVYPIFDNSMTMSFAQLIKKADVITPNLTEACLLAEVDYPQDKIPHPDFVWELARSLSEKGPRTVVITGVLGEDELIHNMAYVAGQDKQVSASNRKIGGSFSGTGDILSAIVCGGLLRGDDIEEVLNLAGQLFERAISLSVGEGADPREGIAFEPFLSLLSGE